MKPGDIVRLNELGRKNSQKNTHDRQGVILRELTRWKEFSAANTIWEIKWGGRKKPQGKSENYLELCK